MHKILSALIVMLILTSCVAAPDLTTNPTNVQATDKRDALVASLAGTWDNRAQFSAVAETLKVPPSVNGDWLDLQHATFARVDAPLLGTHVLYLEWRNNSRQGAISRQRIWSFRIDDANVMRMDFYAFIDGAPWAGQVGDAGKESAANVATLFRTLAPAALRGYGAACGLRFEATGNTYRGAITASECSLVAASGRAMGIDASVALLADGTLEYRESGKLADGRYAFRVPPTMPYQFVKLGK